MQVVLTIAGSDSSGGAGVQADLRVLAALGVYAACAVTAVTAQGYDGVRAVHAVDTSLVSAQIDAVAESMPVAAVKIGMLHTCAVAEAVADALERHAFVNMVLDPVLVSSSGMALLDEAGLAVLRRRLLPRCTLLTPNVAEAGRLLNEALGPSDRVLMDAARRLRNLGPRAVWLTGGDRSGDADDALATEAGERMLSVERVPTRHTHGTGCTASTAAAALLARGRDVETAVVEAKAFVTAALEQAFDLGDRFGAMHTLFEFYGNEGLP